MGPIRPTSIVEHPAILTALLVALIGLGVALPAAAQTAGSWTGTSGVGVEVEDEDGRAVEGAEVRLTFSDEQAGGPAPATTDARGRAEVPGLTPGEWVLTVRHPDTMAFVATLQVRENRKPKEIAASQVKMGDSLRSLRVDYFEVSGPPERPPRPPEPAPEPEPKPAPEPEERPEPSPEPSAEPAPPPAEAPEAPAEEAPAEARPAEPAPEPETKPAEEPTRAETPDEERPAPTTPSEPEPSEPEVAAPSEPASEAPPAAPSEPAPAPAPSTEPEPEPRPTPSEPEEPAPAPPRQTTLRSQEAGTCPECRPGEWAVSTRGVAAPEGTICPADLEERVRRAAGVLGASRALGPWTGPIELAGGATSVLGDQAYGDFTTALRTVLADDASCRTLAVMLPAGAEFGGFQYEAADGDSWVRCLPGEDCPAIGVRWTDNPLLVRTPAGMVVAGAFLNVGSARRPIRLTVYFSPPEGWKPR